MSDRPKTKKLNKFLRHAAIVMLCLMMVLPGSLRANADVATDSLTVKVGYNGMAISEYVEVDKWHWRDLRDHLQLHKVAYSYFQSSGKTHYNAIVDSAQGFYVKDLLDYANIYYGDVKSLKFYVEDHKGIRTSFDSSSLFASRYYYDDLAGHRTIVYGKKTVTEEVTETVHHDAEYETEKYTETVHHDAEYKTEKYTEEVDGEEVEKEREVLVKEAWDEEVEKEREVLVKEAWDEEVTHTVEKEIDDKSKIIEYTFDEAKRYSAQVQPMLAVEDNWAQFNEEFEHIGPDYSSMNAGNRFRLLFGQTSPTESLTSRSDKYVSCVYVTLEGGPTVGEMGGLNGSYGSHTVEMTVNADNTNIRDALSRLMDINSTNTDVLAISGIEVLPDATYSDLAKVVVSYEIIGDGDAAITVGVGSESAPLATSETVKADRAAEESGSAAGEGGSGPSDNENKSDAGSTKNDQTDRSNKGSGSANSNNKKNDDNRISELKTEKKEASQKSKSIVTYQLSDAAAQNLENALMKQTMTAALEEEDIEEVLIEDNTEEQREHERKLLVVTGLGSLLIAGLGAGAETVSFNIRLKGRKKR